MRFSGWENTRCQPRTGVLCVVEQNKMGPDSSCFLTFVEMRRFVSEPVQHVKHEKGQMQKDWTVGLLPSLHISQRAETSRMSCLKRHLHLRLVWSVRPDSGIGHQDPSWVQRTWGDAREHHHHPWCLNPAPIVQVLKRQIKIPSDRCQHPLFSWNILSLFCLLCNFWSL